MNGNQKAHFIHTIEEDTMNKIIKKETEGDTINETVKKETSYAEMLICNYDNVQDNSNEMVVENNSSDHVVIIKGKVDIVDGQLQMYETYYCEECNIEYPDRDRFVEEHSKMIIDIVNDNNSNNQIEVTTLNTQSFEVPSNMDDIIKNEEQVYIIEEQIDDVVYVAEFPESLLPKLDNNDKESDKAEHYICCDCQKVFVNKLSAQEHNCQINTSEEKVKLIESTYSEKKREVINNTCRYCQKYFLNNDDLLDHMEKCKKKKSKKKEKDHEIIELDSELYINIFHCDLCSNDFTSLRAFRNHKVTHNKTIKIPVETTTSSDLQSVNALPTCDICKTEFQSEKSLKLHMKMHKRPEVKSIQDVLPAGAQKEYNEMNQFYCEICKKSFNQRLLTIHRNMHKNIKVYNCSKCNRKFENLLSYNLHLQMHWEISRVNNETGEKLMQGNENNNNSINKSKTQQPHQLNNDVNKSSNTGDRKKFPCQYCGREFRRPYEKVKHERVHTGEKPHTCEVCGKRFRVQYSLTLHLRTHTDIRPYACGHCNKRYKSHSVYMHHVKTHSKERLYKCDMCSKSFQTSVQLCAHKNSHTKPFVCTQCNRPFATLYSLKVHMNTHLTVNSSFKRGCTICGATYLRVFALNCHLKEKHNIDVNGFSYVKKQELEKNLNDNCNNDQDYVTQRKKSVPKNNKANHLQAEEIIISD